jgi:spoIIIJ-associated protein
MSVTKADLDKIKKETEKLLELLSVDLDCSASADLKGVLINLSGKDSAILIGFHGENLSSFAYLLGLILHRKFEKDIVFKVDVNGYLKEKDKKITEMVMRSIEKVQTSGYPEEISGFSPYERRLAHNLASKEGLDSESRGPSNNRILVIKPKISKE